MLFDVAKAIVGGLAAAGWIIAIHFLMAGWLAWYLQAMLGLAIVAGLVYIVPNKMTGHYVRPFPEDR